MGSNATGSDQEKTGGANEGTPKRRGANVLQSRGGLTVGENTLYNGECKIKGEDKVFIGKYCAIAENFRVIASNHNYKFASLQNTFYMNHFGTKPPPLRKQQPITIGNNVWFGDNVIVVPGADIGDGACIGAGSVVTGEIPPFAIAAGVPARVLKYRFSPEIIEVLLEVKWWDWPEDRIKRNKEFFLTDLTTVESAQALRTIIVD
jgi:acetyltransferase-like isoleucine patch superfamily enzyme